MKKYIVVGIVIFCSFYIFGSFYYMTFNPNYWDNDFKIIMGVFSIGTPICKAYIDFLSEVSK